MRFIDVKILYLHQYFTTPSYCGGVRSYQFAKRLVESGHCVDMITSTAFFPSPRRHFQLISKHEVDGVKVHAIHIGYGNNMSFIRRIVAFLLFMLVSSAYALSFKGRGLVLASSTPLTIAVPALVVKWIYRIPLIFEVRDLWPDVPIAMGIIKNKWAQGFLRWFEMLVYRHSRKIVALSTGMQEVLIAKGVSAEKIVVVPNACDMAEFERDRPCPHELVALKQEPDTKLCLYAGTFGYVNNLSYLLDLAVEVKKRKVAIKFVLIGSGAEREMLLRRVCCEGLEGQVVIFDPVGKQVLIDYIKSVDACISFVQNNSVLFNNSANKFFDSLAAGKPIIINHGGWQADVIEENRLGIVLSRDVQRSVSRLTNFLFDGKGYAAEEILEFAQKNYSRDVLYERFYSFAIRPFMEKVDGS